MALASPQADLPSLLRGGSDTWDEGAAGLILTSEFFAPVGSVYDIGCYEVSVASEMTGQSLNVTVVTTQSSTVDHVSTVSLTLPIEAAEPSPLSDEKEAVLEHVAATAEAAGVGESSSAEATSPIVSAEVTELTKYDQNDFMLWLPNASNINIIKAPNLLTLQDVTDFDFRYVSSLSRYFYLNGLSEFSFEFYSPSGNRGFSIQLSSLIQDNNTGYKYTHSFGVTASGASMFSDSTTLTTSLNDYSAMTVTDVGGGWKKATITNPRELPDGRYTVFLYVYDQSNAPLYQGDGTSSISIRNLTGFRKADGAKDWPGVSYRYTSAGVVESVITDVNEEYDLSTATASLASVSLDGQVLTLVEDTSTGFHSADLRLDYVGIYSYSVEYKLPPTRGLNIHPGGDFEQEGDVSFDIYTDVGGATVFDNSGQTLTITDVGDGWYRFTHMFVSPVNIGPMLYLGLTAGAYTYDYTGDGVTSIQVRNVVFTTKQGISATISCRLDYNVSGTPYGVLFNSLLYDYSEGVTLLDVSPDPGFISSFKLYEEATYTSHLVCFRGAMSDNRGGSSYAELYFKADGGRGFAFDIYLESGVFAYGSISKDGVAAPGGNCTTTVTDAGGGWYKVRIDFHALTAIGETIYIRVMNDVGALTYQGDPTKYLHIADFSLQKAGGVPVASDLTDYTWTAGGTGISASQDDAAQGLDASIMLMLSILAEYETATAIDLPASQYTTTSSAAETSTGNDSSTSSYATFSARNEAGNAANSETVEQSAGVSSAATVVAVDETSNVASTTAASSEVGSSAETQVGYMNTMLVQNEAGSLLGVGSSVGVLTESVTEAGTALDNLTHAVTTVVSLLAGLTATEVLVTSYSFSVGNLESTAADATQSASANFVSSEVEEVMAADASVGSAITLSSLSESSLAVDQSEYQSSLLNLNLAESSILLDVPSSVIVAITQITGSATLAEVAQASQTTQFSSLEALVSVVTQAGVVNWLAQVGEAVFPIGDQSSNVSTSTTATEAATSNTYADNGGSTTVVAQEPATLAEVSQTSTLALSNKTEPAIASEETTREGVIQASAAELTYPSEGASTEVAGVTSATEPVVAADLPWTTHSGGVSTQESVLAEALVNAGLTTVLNTIASATGGDVAVSVSSIDLTLGSVVHAAESTTGLVSFDGVLLEVVAIGEGYTCTLVADITLEEPATAVTIQLADLNVVLDVLKLQNVFLVSREVRGHRISMDLRDLVIEVERRGFDVPQDIREIAVAIERRSYNVAK